MTSMPAAASECAHCHMPISDPTTRVIHGGLTFCCPNCSAALEQYGPGSDPKSTSAEGELRCAMCRVPIKDESTMQSRGDDAYCCANCMNAASQHESGGETQVQQATVRR